VSRNFIAGIFFLLSSCGYAQRVLVLNEVTKEPIEGVIVYAEGQTDFATTDVDGYVRLNLFPAGSALIFQHPFYHLQDRKLSEFSSENARVFLKEKIIRIDEVVISANKWEQNKSEIPFEILSIKASGIAFDNAQTSADILESTGQVFVQRSQLGGGSPMIRGFGANAVLLVVDGVRMNNPIFRSGNLQNIINIDPNALESSEVVFGPGAVIYGSDALGGVMDFHTISPKFSNSNKLLVDGHAMVRYSTADNEKTANVLLTLGKRKFGYAGSFTFSDFDNLRTGAVRPDAHKNFGKRPEYVTSINGIDSIVANSNENLQVYSGYKQISTLQKVNFRLSDFLEVGYMFNYSTTTDIPRYDRLTEYNGETLDYARWYYGPQKWMMNAIKLTYFKPNKFFEAAKVTVAFQNFEESRHDRKYRASILRNRTEEVGVLSLNVDMEKVFSDESQFFYGLEYLYSHVNSAAYSLDTRSNETFNLSTRYPGGGSDVNNFALYGSYKKPLSPKKYLSAGLRYTFQNLYSSFTNDEFSYNSIHNISSALNGNVGLVIKPNQKWNVSGMLSTGFRAPNLDDISKVFDSEPGNVIVPNPGLKPEYAYNTEISVSKYFGDKFEISGTVFYSFLHNAMVRGDFKVKGADSIIYDGELSNVQAVVNTGRAHVYGISGMCKMDLTENWAASFYGNYTKGRDLINDEPLRHTTPVFGLASLFYNRSKFQGEFFIRFNGNVPFDDLPPSEKNKPYMYSSDGSLSWYTLNIRMQYQLNDVFLINAATENILDHHYRTYSSGISAPGRNFIISLKARL